MTASITCEQCGKEFDAVRTDARFCGPACRKAASRAKNDRGSVDKRPGEPLGEGNQCDLSVTTTSAEAPPSKSVSVTHNRPLPPGLVADPDWPGMFRVVRPDGSLSDMVNYTRAVDALRAQHSRERERLREAAE
jgi:hypothetical protein